MTRVVNWDGSVATNLTLARVGEGVGWQEWYRNHCPNSNFSAGTTAPSSVASSSTVTSSFTEDAPFEGVKSMRLTVATEGALSLPVSNILPETGKTFTLIMMVRPVGKPLALSPRIRSTLGPLTQIPANVWSEVRFTGVAGSGNNIQTGGFVAASNGHQIGDQIDIGLVSVVDGTYTGPPFSGETEPLGEFSRTQWTGAAGASASVRELRASKMSVKHSRTMPPILSASGFHALEGGGSVFSKGPDTPMMPASMTKMMTMYVARKYVSDAMLQDTVTVIAGDLANGVTGGLQAGDVVSFETLFHGMLMLSASDSSNVISRTVGKIIRDLEGGDLSYHATFRAKANQYMTEWGWKNAWFHSSMGLDTIARYSTRQLCDLMFKLDDYSLLVSRTPSYQATASGPNPRTWTYTHSLSSRFANFPGLLGIKTGSLEALSIEHSGVVLMYDRGGSRHAICVNGAWPSSNRWEDAEAIRDLVSDAYPI